jgi:hypothetical protein
MDYQSTLTGLVPGWTYSYKAVAWTNDYLTVEGVVRTFTTPTVAEPSWVRVLMPASIPSLVALGSGFAVRGGTWGSPTWSVAFDGDGGLLWQRMSGTADEASSPARSTGTGFVSVARIRKAANPTPADWNSEVTRVDATGSVAWQRSFSGWVSVGGPTTDGGVHLLGDPGQGLVWARVTPSGTVAWAAMNDSGMDPLALLELQGGALASVGRSVRLAGSHDGIPVEVRDADGTLVWRRVYWRADGEHAEAVEAAPGGGLVLAGYTWAGPLQEPLVLRLASDGTVLWSVRLAGELGSASGLAPAGDGGWLVAGSGNLGSPDTRYIWVAKLDAAGQCLWASRFPGKYQAPVSVLARSGGGFVLTAHVEVGYNLYGVAVVMADPGRRAGGSGTDVVLSAAPAVLTADQPSWADRIVVFPSSTAGGAPLRTTNLAAVQLAP